MPDRASSANSASFDTQSLAAAVGGAVVLASPTPIRGGAVDSRLVEPGNVFFALPGERTDGHRFLGDAVGAGAAALIVTRDVGADEFGDVTVIRVDDGLLALRRAASAWRARFTPLTIGVTGSLAKTSTKEQIAELLSVRWQVLRNRANENNEIGLPLTLLRLAPDDQVAVLEMGMYTPGDIRVLAEIARPSIGVVTAVRGTHLERAGSIDAIERGKRELVEALPAGGTAVLNADDPRVSRMADHLPPTVNVVRYGFGGGADVRADEVESKGADGMRFRLVTDGGTRDASIPALGRHSVHNALAAVAVGLTAGLALDETVDGLARRFVAPHRSTLVETGEWQILDDTYNAAPDSMIAALDLLASLPGSHIAVLGEMLELGDQSDDAHRRVGAHVARTADHLVAVGRPAEIYAAAAEDAGLPRGRITTVDDRAAAFDALTRLIEPGAVVLLKASNGQRFFDLVEQLTEFGKRQAVA